jgi:probable rRNA maturation factor
MNKVFFGAEEIPLPPWTKAADNFVRSVLKNIGAENWELSVLFCNNRFIKSLNGKYRDKDEPTDVLSFPLGETSPGGRFLAGDIVISLDALEENASFFKVSVNEELRRLLVHGILHLTGYDHSSNRTDEPMLAVQEKILAAFAGERICETAS